MVGKWGKSYLDFLGFLQDQSSAAAGQVERCFLVLLSEH